MARPKRTLAEAVALVYSKTRPKGGCLVYTGVRLKNGRALVGCNGKKELAHRLVARYYLGPCPEGMEVRHLCGCGHEGCVTASHLRYGTRSENTKDAFRHGALRSDGEHNPLAKLTWRTVRELRQAHRAGGVTQAALGRRFGVTQSTVSLVVNNKVWAERTERRGAVV